MNNGVDSPVIWHFSHEDFETVMDRAEQYSINILGIECWSQKRIKRVKYIEEYPEVANWHRKAVAELRRGSPHPCIYAATFEIPPSLLYTR